MSGVDVAGNEATDRAAASAGTTRAILAMLASMAGFVAGDGLVRLAAGEVPLGQLIVIRGVIATSIIFALAWATGVLGAIRHVFTRPMLVRAASDVSATHFFFTGLLLMPFADATSIGQVTPLAVTAGAAFFLGEPVGWRRWLATCVGFLGVLIIIRPGSSAFNWGAVFILACVASVALRDLLTRRLGSHLPTLIVALSTMVAVTLSGLVRGMFEVWTMPTLGTLALVASAAVTNCVGYYFGIIAMRSGDVAAVEPFRFSAILFGVLLGVAVFGEVPDRTTVVGILVVISAGLYTLHRERVRGVRPVTADVKEPHP